MEPELNIWLKKKYTLQALFISCIKFFQDLFKQNSKINCFTNEPNAHSDYSLENKDARQPGDEAGRWKEDQLETLEFIGPPSIFLSGNL